MSDLRPRGVPIVLGGVERHFLFTLNIIDEIQDKYGKNMHEVIEDLTHEEVFEHTLRDLTVILINDEAEKRGNETLPLVTEQEVGEMIGLDNYYLVMATILKAYGISLPEPDEDNDPNRESGQQNN